MGSRPRVLVLMATHNGQRHLADQLDSILAQEGADITIRIKDDCSADSTYRILETYASEHPNIELFYNAKSQGATRCIMDLIYDAPAAEYDYFALADQGDIWHSNRITAGSAHISSNTSRAELYYAGVDVVGENGEILHGELVPYEVCAAHTGSLLLVQNWCLACTVLMNGALVKLLRQHQIYDFGRPCDAWVHAVALYCGGYAYCDLRQSLVDKRAEEMPALQTPDEFSKMAHVLLREYEQDMEPDTVKLVEAVAVRRISAKARRYLYGRKDIVATTKPRTTQLRWQILLNQL